jgi:hypothetical protein
MNRLALIVSLLLACSRTPLGLHAFDGGSPGAGGAGGTPTTAGMAGTGGLPPGSGGSIATADLDTCSSDADCLSSCIWVTTPTSSSQCTAFYCCGMTQLSKRRCEANQAAWASFCPNESPTNEPCKCVEVCDHGIFGCVGGRCMTSCPPNTDASPDVAFVATSVQCLPHRSLPLLTGVTGSAFQRSCRDKGFSVKRAFKSGQGAFDGVHGHG